MAKVGTRAKYLWLNAIDRSFVPFPLWRTPTREGVGMSTPGSHARPHLPIAQSLTTHRLHGSMTWGAGTCRTLGRRRSPPVGTDRALTKARGPTLSCCLVMVLRRMGALYFIYEPAVPPRNHGSSSSQSCCVASTSSPLTAAPIPRHSSASTCASSFLK